MMYKLLPQPKTQHDIDDLPSHHCATPIDLPPLEFKQEAIFAAGTFWDLELAFCRVDGVVRTATGYYGGTLVKPSYREVLEGNTGHTEAVKVIYDKRKVSYESLCNVFWACHDPTNKDYLRFGVNTHHRSAIFYASDEERKQAQASKIQWQIKLNRRIVTKILPCPSADASGFYMAESRHQKNHLQMHHVRLCESLNLRSAQHFADSHVACKLNGILGSDEKNGDEDLKSFMARYQLPKQANIVLEGIIQELRVKHALVE